VLRLGSAPLAIGVAAGCEENAPTGVAVGWPDATAASDVDSWSAWDCGTSTRWVELVAPAGAVVGVAWAVVGVGLGVGAAWTGPAPPDEVPPAPATPLKLDGVAVGVAVEVGALVGAAVGPAWTGPAAALGVDVGLACTGPTTGVAVAVGAEVAVGCGVAVEATTGVA